MDSPPAIVFTMLFPATVAGEGQGGGPAEAVRQSGCLSVNVVRVCPRLVTQEMTIVKMKTYVNFAGTCAEAFRFYEEHLGGQIGMMMTHGQAPDQSKVNPDWKDAVLHARVSIGGTELMGADIPNAQPMRSAYLSLNVDSDGEAERIFAALSAGGEIFMPMQETFFAARFGQLRDRFGVNWMIVHERPARPGA